MSRREDGPNYASLPRRLSTPNRTDLVRAKGLFGDRVSIMGNVPSTDLMLLGTPEDVERESVDCITRGGLGGGYLLGADCLLARDTPAESITAMVRAAERCSVYRNWQ